MNAIQRAIHILGGPSATARAVGVSAQLVCFWRDGKRGLPVEKCAAVEAATRGMVTRQDLRPADWQAIWPELTQALATTAQPAADAAPWQEA